MLQSDIDKLLAIRSAWDKFKSKDKAQKLAKDYDDYYKVVWSHGIERKDEIVRFNDEVCIAVLREYRTIGGACDGCIGYEGTPPCFALYSDKSCYITKAHAGMQDDLYRSMLQSIRKAVKAMGYKTTKESEAHAFDKQSITTLNMGTTPLIVEELQSREKRAEETGRYYVFCPEGHGLYCKYEQILLGDILDLLWEP